MAAVVGVVLWIAAVALFCLGLWLLAIRVGDWMLS